jgi:hypothetical protein
MVDIIVALIGAPPATVAAVIAAYAASKAHRAAERVAAKLDDDG